MAYHNNGHNNFNSHRDFNNHRDFPAHNGPHHGPHTHHDIAPSFRDVVNMAPHAQRDNEYSEPAAPFYRGTRSPRPNPRHNQENFVPRFTHPGFYPGNGGFKKSRFMSDEQWAEYENLLSERREREHNQRLQREVQQCIVPLQKEIHRLTSSLATMEKRMVSSGAPSTGGTSAGRPATVSVRAPARAIGNRAPVGRVSLLRRPPSAPVRTTAARSPPPPSPPLPEPSPSPSTPPNVEQSEDQVEFPGCIAEWGFPENVAAEIMRTPDLAGSEIYMRPVLEGMSVADLKAMHVRMFDRNYVGRKENLVTFLLDYMASLLE